MNSQIVEMQKHYAEILQEINIRVDAINHSLNGGVDLSAPFLVEFCYLQIRMICELVALGCLVVHGDIAGKKLEKHWSADDIMKKLQELHPQFYPIAVRRVQVGVGFALRKSDPQPLIKDEFLKLYGKLGDSLHRGSLRRLLKPTTTHQENFPQVMKKLQGLMDMMSGHVMLPASGKISILCTLRRLANQIQPEVAVVEHDTPINYNDPEFLSSIF